MRKNKLPDVVEFTKYLMKEYHNGNPKPWLNSLSPKSIYTGTGEGIIFGAKNIKEKFRVYAENGRGKIYSEEYFKVPIDDNAAIVIAQITTGKQNDENLRISSIYTFVFKLIGTETRMIFEHNSYEYFREDSIKRPTGISMDTYTFQLIKHLLIDDMDSKKQKRIPIETEGQTIYLNLDTLLYIKSDGHISQLHCIDKVLPCSKTIKSLMDELPSNFYHIHRSYIINVNYLKSIRCYEAERVSGIKIPIPSANYSKVKTDLKNIAKHI